MTQPQLTVRRRVSHSGACTGAAQDESSDGSPIVKREVKNGLKRHATHGQVGDAECMTRAPAAPLVRSQTQPQAGIEEGSTISTHRRRSAEHRRELVVGIAAMQRARSETAVSAVTARMTKLAQDNLHLRVQWLHEGNINEWPPCTVLWTLWTPDFPMDELKAYMKHAKPFELNSLDGLSLLRDRRLMMRTCVEWRIPVPQFVECSRDGACQPVVEESEEHIKVDEATLKKPFLEKPADASDDSLFLYFPASAGGGRGRVGRMGFDSASTTDQMLDTSRSRVRRDSSYIYTQFIPSEGFDLQVLVAGSSYVLGEVQHNMQTGFGDTSRSSFVPVLLEAEEKQLAQRLRLAFGMEMFRVQMLRTQLGASLGGPADGCYVIEMDPEYGGMPRTPKNGEPADPALIDDIARAILAQIRQRFDHKIYSAQPTRFSRIASWQGALVGARSWHAPSSKRSADLSELDGEDPLAALAETEELESPQLEGQQLESHDATPGGSICKSPPQLLAVLAVVRHGDRTPKQKVKLKLQVSKSVGDTRFFFGMLLGWIMGISHNAKAILGALALEFELRSASELQRLYSILQEVIGGDKEEAKEIGDEIPESTRPANPSLHNCCLLEASSAKDHSLLLAACEVLGQAVSQAGAPNMHAKLEADGDVLKIAMKWGGDLTSLGEEQARELGMNFRKNVYPDEDTARMHATLRHDLKVHSSSEPRCAQTAAAFAQGLLSIQATLAAVQVSFVRLDGLGRLDNTPFARSPLVEKAKAVAQALLDSDRAVDADFQREVLCEPSRYRRACSNLEVLRQQETTVRTDLQRCAQAVIRLNNGLSAAIEQAQTDKLSALLEVLPLVLQRWIDIAKDIQTKGTPRAPPDRVAHMLDNAKFDIRHTTPLLRAAGERFSGVCEAFDEVYAICGRISSYSELVECGTSQDDKFEIARTFLQPMLRKLRWDLRAASGQELGEESHHLARHRELYRPANGLDPGEETVRSRLYFAHNHHLQTFVNLLRWAPSHLRFLSEEGEAFFCDMELPLGYLSHFVVKLLRDPSASGAEDHMVRLEFSPGDSSSDQVTVSAVIADGVPLSRFDAFLSELLD